MASAGSVVSGGRLLVVVRKRVQGSRAATLCFDFASRFTRQAGRQLGHLGLKMIFNKKVLSKKIFNSEYALALLQKGKEEGLCSLFSEYYTPLCFFVTRLTSNTLIAEEITADVFIKLWENRNAVTQGGSIKSLLFQMARNRAIDHLRKAKRMAVHQEGLHYFTPEPEKNILQKLAETEMIREIICILQYLPPKCSEVFKLSYLFGKTDKEIAQQLSLSPHTVRNQRLRAIRLLKEKVILFTVLFFLQFYPIF